MFIKTNEEGKVILQHFKPELLSEEVKEQGVILKEVPDEPKVVEGQRAILYYNKEQGAYYEVETRPEMPKEPQEQRIEYLEQVVADLTELILLGGI